MIKHTHIILLLILLIASCKSQESASVGGIKISDREKAMRDSMSRIAASTFIVEGMTQKLTGNYQEAMNSFSKCLAIEPDNDAALFQVAELYIASQQLPKALEFSQKAYNANPKNEWYLLQLAEIYQRTNDTKNAALYYSKLMQLKPRKREYTFYYADALVKNHEENKAIDVLNKLEKENTFDDDVIIQKYRLYAYMKKYPEAIKEVQKLIERKPYDVGNYGIVAELYEESGNKEKALEYYRKILDIDPENGIVHLSLAQYYYNENKDDEGYSELKQAFSSQSLSIEVKMKILYDFYDKGNDPNSLKEAYELLDILEKTHPSDSKSYAIYSDFLNRDERYPEARDKTRKAIEFDENVFLLWNQLLVLDSQLNDKSGLYTDSKRAMELFPSQSIVYYYGGLAAYQVNKYEEAKEALETGKDLVIENQGLQMEFLQLLGDVYNKLKMYTESDKAYEEALKIDANNYYVMNNYAYYLALRKTKLTRAAELSKKSNELQPNSSNFQDTYAYVLFVQGNYAEAETWIKKAIANGGDKSGTILEHYGDILFKLNKPNEALDYWKRAKEKGGTSDVIDRKISTKTYIE